MTPPPPKHAAIAFNLSHTSFTPPLLSLCLYSIVVHAHSECLHIVFVHANELSTCRSSKSVGISSRYHSVPEFGVSGFDEGRPEGPQDEDEGSGEQGDEDE